MIIVLKIPISRWKTTIKIALSFWRWTWPLTYDSAVEVVGQHPLTDGHQQPESFLLFGVKQQHRRQDVHGLHGERRTTVRRKQTHTGGRRSFEQQVHSYKPPGIAGVIVYLCQVKSVNSQNIPEWCLSHLPREAVRGEFSWNIRVDKSFRTPLKSDCLSVMTLASFKMFGSIRGSQTNWRFFFGGGLRIVDEKRIEKKMSVVLLPKTSCDGHSHQLPSLKLD